MTTKAQLAEQLLAASIHEIKNRFGLMFSQLDTLLTTLPLNEQHQHDAEHIKSEAQFVGSELVRVLASYKALMYGDTGNDTLEHDQQFVLDFLEEKIARHSNTVRAHALQLTYECDEDLDGFFDPALISIILDTAIYNAVKEHARTLLLSAEKRVAEGSAETLLIRIEDDGPGFPQSVLEDTGNPAAPGHTRPLRDDGHSTGLGLYFARTLIAQHHAGGRQGQIHLGVSDHLGGASVTLILPQ
ncbi:MAG: ATP-binding protein [Ketobacter sp.]|nr:MAG: ATP-binding protein [Ketobacter sp.]